jgi:hypothetical protein
MKRRKQISIRQQAGLVFLLIVLVLLLIGGIMFFVSAGGHGVSSAKIDRDQITLDALAAAKNALLAYTISRDDYSSSSRPGEFPCPTTVPPDDPSYGKANTSCNSIPKIGRIPWRTLGIPEPRDAYGEPLWYSLSSNFKPSTTVAINSNSLGQLVVYQASETTPLESQAVVVVFAVGPPVTGQNRSAAIALCPNTGTAIAQNVCASNYLEAYSGKNNATDSGPFTLGKISDMFNDRVALITTADFIPKIEDRIATSLTKTLKAYYQMHNVYPYAAYYSDIKKPNPDNKNASQPAQANCADGIFSGRFPEYINDSLVAHVPTLPHLKCSGYLVGSQEWSGIASENSLPVWFFTNNWHTTIFYSVAKQYVQGGSKSCTNLGDCLKVEGDFTVQDVQAVIILPGIPLTTQSRPTRLPDEASAGLDIRNYFEDPENRQGWNLVPDNYIYRSVASTQPSRDRVVVIKN